MKFQGTLDDVSEKWYLSYNDNVMLSLFQYDFLNICNQQSLGNRLKNPVFLQSRENQAPFDGHEIHFC